MPTDLVLRAVSSAEPARPAPRAPAPVATAPAMPVSSAPATPNPRLRLDGSLGMVVLEFRGTGGEVANTIPSPRAIAAYRAAAISDAPVPVGVRPMSGAAPAPEPTPG
ncbi:MAG TPA: hypothetical protein VN329_11685 [Roseomonas sp.]|nr:hypothetical protein [Roseomonas sp.]